MNESDQPRPDLDAAIDAVLPAITNLGDEAVAASLRRTRIALAEPRAAGFGAWRWAVPAAALVATAIVAAFIWWPRGPVDAPPSAIVDARPPASPTPLPAATPEGVTPGAPTPRSVRPQRFARALRVEATSAPPIDEASPPKALASLVRAVQQIPEDAWDRSVEQASATFAVAPLMLDPIRVAPLETPALADTPPAESIVPGEP